MTLVQSESTSSKNQCWRWPNQQHSCRSAAADQTVTVKMFEKDSQHEALGGNIDNLDDGDDGNAISDGGISDKRLSEDVPAITYSARTSSVLSCLSHVTPIFEGFFFLTCKGGRVMSENIRLTGRLVAVIRADDVSCFPNFLVLRIIVWNGNKSTFGVLRRSRSLF